MVTEAKATALTRREAEAQIRAWIATGLPDGKLSLDTDLHAALDVAADPSLVMVWAVALGQQVRILMGAVSVQARPEELPGWTFEVWSNAPKVQPQQRIRATAVDA